MKKLELFNKEKTYMYPNGSVASGERIANDFPAVEVFQHAIETDECGQVCFAVLNLGTLRAEHKIDAALTDEDAILAIEEIINAPQVAPEPSAEERIAAAMEFQNMLALANMQVTEEPTIEGGVTV